MNTRSTYEKPEGVTILGGVILAVAFSIPVWAIVLTVAWAVTR